MFFHNFKYFTVSLIKNKVMIFWIFLFPLALMTMFNFAFSSITENTENFSMIPVSVVFEGEENAEFKAIMSDVSTGEEPLFDVSYVSSDEALKSLKNGTTNGIIYCSNEGLKLSVGAGSSIEKTIISSFVQQYSENVQVITDAAKKNPANIQAVVEAMSTEISAIAQSDFSSENSDVFIIYYYGLFAMTALFGTMHGMYCVITYQANLSKTGARISASPAGKFVLLTSALSVSALQQALAMLCATAYGMFVLKINFGVDFGMMMLINIVGGTTGVALGFFVGSFGRMGENMKRSILLGITMVCSIFAGLISPDISYVIHENAPIIERINPAKLIADCYYSINIYGNYDMVVQNLATLGGMCLIFCIGGALIARRRKYASL